jgi:hypothetical protein
MLPLATVPGDEIYEVVFPHVLFKGGKELAARHSIKIAGASR